MRQFEQKNRARLVPKNRVFQSSDYANEGLADQLTDYSSVEA